MKLVRTFHPVGHGAFYTEQFYDEKDVCVFAAVYDCGGGPVGGMNKFAHNFVNNPSNLNINGRIDVLFISHFHSDHISGLPYLLRHCDRIVLPVLTKSLLLEGAMHNADAKTKEDNVNYDVNQILYDIFTRSGDYYDGNKMVFIEESNEEDNNSFEEITIEEARGTIKRRIAFKSNKIPNWIFYPYNLKKGQIEKKIEEFFKSNDVIKNDGTIDIQKFKEVLKRRNFRKVKAVYREAHNEDTNYHSMTVYSGHKDCHIARYCLCCCSCEDIKCNKCNNIDANPHCLFMGDYPATESNIDKLRIFYRMYWHCKGSVQVPHHGSDKVSGAYGRELFDSCRLGVLSVKFGRHSGVPSSYVIKELINHDVSPVYVTDDVRTKLIKAYNI